MADLKKNIYNLILKFVVITFCLLMKTDYVAAEDFDGKTLFYCKVSSELVHSVDLFLTLEVFLGPCIQPGHCS